MLGPWRPLPLLFHALSALVGLFGYFAVVYLGLAVSHLAWADPAIRSDLADAGR